MFDGKKLEGLWRRAEATPRDYEIWLYLFEGCRACEATDFRLVRQINKRIRLNSARQAVDQKLEKWLMLNRKALLLDAPWDFDAYMLYVEIEREPAKRFYEPRRNIIRPVVNIIQDLADDKLDMAAVSMPPGSGKSTVGIFGLSWLMGKHPDKPNLASAHADKLTRSFYEGVNTIITDPEYLWGDVFPGVKYLGTNSKDETIDLDKPKRFKSLTCRSIGGGLTGATRCESLLYADDLCSGIEEATSIDRLDKLWEAYANDLKSRKKQGCKELHIATRWSVHDVIGRLERLHAGDPRAKFFAMPALNENGESNFDYRHGVGFDTKYFLDMKSALDDVSWRALFMNEPIEREGLLFPDDELLTYNGILPDGEPDRIIAACDVAWGGGDSLSMPIGYLYGGDCYIPDVVFDSGDKEATRPKVVAKLTMHRPHVTRFEANNGGDEYKDNVDRILRENGVKLNISARKAPTTASKLSRIIQAAPDIKRFIFLDKDHRDSEYRAFMKELTSFLQTGKNKHDDAPDSLGMLSELTSGGGTSITPIKRPF